MLEKNSDFSTIEHLVDLRPVCKLKFVRWGPVENTTTKALYLSGFDRGCPPEFEDAFSKYGNYRFQQNYHDHELKN